MKIHRAARTAAALVILGVGASIAARQAPLSEAKAGDTTSQVGIPGQKPVKSSDAPRSRATTYWPAKDWPWPESMESVNSAWRNHKILWQNDVVRLIEVTIRPGETEAMHDHPYPSVFMYDSPWPSGSGAVTDKQLMQNDPRNQPFGDRAPAPKGEQYPTCATAGPQAPHQATNHGDFPIHFYRVEFKRIDGDGIAQHWKQWYPWMLEPLKPVNEIKSGSNLGPPFSKLFPYSIAYDSPKAAPNNHYVRYADNHVRFIEVVFRPGETEALHGHPYPSVFATNSASGMGDDGIPGEKPQNQDHSLDPQDPHNWPIGGIAKGPAGQAFPVCVTMDPQAPHHVTDNGTYPTHFYRMEFLRIDGDGIKTHWKDWHYDVVPRGPATKTLGK